MADTKKKTSMGRSSSSAKKKSTASSRSAGQERTRKTAAEKQEALYKKKLIHDDICAVIIIVLGILLLVWSLKPESSGAIGRPVNSFLFGVLGKAAYAVPYFLILFGALIFTRKLALLTLRTWLAIALLFIAAAAIFSVNAAATAESLKGGALKAFYEAGKDGGGVLGTVFAYWLLKAAGKTALYIICGALMIIALIFIVNTPISSWLDERKINAKARKEARNDEREQFAEIEARKRLEKEEAAKAAALAAAEKAANAPLTSGGEKPLSLFDKIKELEDASQKKKENIVALAASETPGKGGETGGQNAEPPKPPVDELPAKTEAPKASQSFEEAAFAAAANTPVQASPAAQTAVSELQQPGKYKPPVEGLTPESIGRKTAVPGENISDNQQKILDYVRDDTLFSGGVKAEGYGLNAEKKEADPPAPAAKEPKARSSEVKPAPAEEKNVKPVQMQIEELPPKYVFPPIDLLKQPQGAKNTHSMDDLNAQARLLEETLASFGVSASVVDMIK
ncbi:MAG: DNA translocase FtsK 4TM domain-containing protein, partial [Firmicutes bacterium]|nr:DNA translocase FtsK 4TM domain-containing protein [Bacillota bacterium]